MNPETVCIPPQTRSAVVPGSEAPSRAVGAHRVLAVDDDAGMLRINQLTLTRAGYLVSVAADGEAAWEQLSEEDFDLVLTDHDLPRLTGLKLVERMRDRGMWTPVILASGSIAGSVATDYPSLHLAAVLMKPFTSAELIASVKAALALPAHSGRS